MPSEETTQRKYVGQGGQYVREHTVKAEVPDLAETLAQAKRQYNETLLNRIRDGRWSNTPFCLDAVFAALAATGADDRACRVAAGTEATLDHCPRCDSRLASKNGVRLCTGDGCGWDEEHDRLIYDNDAPARIDAETTTAADGIHGITTRRVPPVAELPNPSDVLVLDATPRVSEIAALFGSVPDRVHGRRRRRVLTAACDGHADR